MFLYLRLSRAHGDGRDAIERQRIDVTRMLAAEGGWTVMGEYVDRDSASAYARSERQGWRALNAGIGSGRVRAVAFWKLDRTLRVAARCLEWVAMCHQQGVHLHSHQDSSDELNSVTAAAKLSTGVKALLAEAETDTMSERQRAAKRHAAQAGFTNGGPRPFGWQPGPRVVDGAGRTGRRLEPHPVEHAALKDAVGLVLAGAGLRQIAMHWQDRHGITGRDGALVSEQKVRSALTSVRMVGYRQHQLPPHQRGVRIDPLEHIARGADGGPVISQEPVCDLATWRRVQETLRSRGTGTHSEWGRHAWLLTGLLFCPCGSPLHGIAQTHRDSQGARVTRYVYRCKANRRYGSGTCTGGASITAAVAEQYVADWLFDCLSEGRLAEYYARAKQTQEAGATRVRVELEQARDELVALQAQLVPQASGVSMAQILLAMVTAAEERIRMLQDELIALTGGAAEPLTHERVVAAWPELNNQSRKALLRQVIDRIDLVPGRGSAAERLRVLTHGDQRTSALDPMMGSAQPPSQAGDLLLGAT
ncbi:recombinase family protein [Promicromonospora sp. NPDC057138]|uniref:recombinase family protein n=1 Tax=Promicromonospora sp. NPDC057138 TaxID=3346031 RepID=UPI0036317631